MGKTQIVLELAYRTREKYRDCSVLWIPATSPESLQQALKDIGQQLGVPGINQDQADIKKLVQRHLSQDSAGQWLLIIDNVDDMSMWENGLKAYLPRSDRGSVVCTTRSMKIAAKIAASNVIQVPEMDEEMAMQMLCKSLINQKLLDHRQDAQKLLERLTSLPLAIAQAAAYINTNSIMLSEYLMLLDEQEEDVIELLSEDFEDEGRYHDAKNPVATTWLISFENIQRIDPLAADYLSFMSCIEPKDIPQSLLPPGRSRKEEIDAIGTLSAYSFVRRRVADESLDVHRLVHLATRNWLKTKGMSYSWTDEALIRLNDVLPVSDYHKSKVWKTYLPHARYLLSYTVEEEELGERSMLLNGLAHCLEAEGRYLEASKAFYTLVENLRRVLGEDNPHTLASMNNLAGTYSFQGRLKEAEKLFLEVLAIDTKTSGEDDMSVSVTRRQLAETYRRQGRWKEAEELQKKDLELCLRILGEDDHLTLSVMNSLASTYRGLGRLKEAEELQVKVLEKCTRLLGGEHPSTFASMNDLALTYAEQTRWKEAEALQVQHLEIRKRVYGEEHPGTLIGISNLAKTLSNRGRWKEAEELQVSVLETMKRVLGEKHPDTLLSMNNLACTLHAQGYLGRAISLMEECCQLQERVIGPQHPDTLVSLKWLDYWRRENVPDNEGDTSSSWEDVSNDEEDVHTSE